MSTAIVTATQLNIRKAESATSDKIGRLDKDTRIDIVSQSGGWAKIYHGDGHGFVNADYIAPLAVPSRVPASAISEDGTKVLAGEVKFGTKFKLGLYNNGATSIDGFIGSHPGYFPDLSNSMINVARAISVNEGKLEAINTWDNAFITFGVFQWTAGTDATAGELPAMLARLKRSDPRVFDFYFGLYGLDVSVASSTSTTGRFLLNGTTLASAADKALLRSHIWAYRFWRAGHDDAVRKAQIEQAMARLGTFYDSVSPKLAGYRLRDWVKSELGVAQLLDQHVNRPGHVPGCIATAIAEQSAKPGKSKPENWTTTDERQMLNRYIVIRETYGATPMTDSTKRAGRISDAVVVGKLSAERGSFIA